FWAPPKSLPQLQALTLDGKIFRAGPLQRSVICPICRGPFRDPVLLDCDHSYCRACITGHWEREGVLSCPHCQKVFNRRNLRTHVKLAVEGNVLFLYSWNKGLWHGEIGKSWVAGHTESSPWGLALGVCPLI
uniref:RING-type domain-containing protein n=1 Tax=Pelusios castaneus TaxID=367368 RepID=A0A8C8VGY8_9SAUR